MNLTVSGVGFSYGDKRALDRIRFEAGAGVLGLLGRNGAGKSTLIRLLATVSAPGEGTITADGVDIFEDPAFLRSRMGYLPQDIGFFPRLTGRETLQYLRGMRPADGLSIDDALESVNLTPDAHRPVGSYSGGMRRRLGIAQALMGRPELLILDEPTAGLDPWERNAFHLAIASLARTATVVFSTHLVEDIERLADTVVVLHDGVVVYDGGVAELRDRAEGKVFESEHPAPDDVIVGPGRHHAFRVISKHGGERPAKARLEDAFMMLTTR